MTGGLAELAAALDTPVSGGGWPDKFGVALRQWCQRENPENTAKPRVLSLFSGAGGLDIGFEDAGFDVFGQVEIERRFVQTLQANSHPEQTTVFHMDIRDFHPRRRKLGKVDFIIGGPPCQSFSAAGRRAAGVAGVHDERGTLFTEYVRLLRQLKPRGFVFENVAGITGANQGAAWSQIQEAFAAAGYRLFHRVLDAADFGVPQHRERLLIVGVRRGRFAFPAPTHGPDAPLPTAFYTAGEALLGVADDDEKPGPVTGRYGGLLEQIPPGLNYSFFTEKLGHPQPLFAWRSKFSDFLYKADPGGPTRTVKAQGGQYTGPFHWHSRPFSVRELKRLQTFPDTWSLRGGRQTAVHQLGNSVPPQLARILAFAIRQQVFKLPVPTKLPLLAENARLTFRSRKRGRTETYRTLAAAAHADKTRRHPLRRPINGTTIAHLRPNLGWEMVAPDARIDRDDAFLIDTTIDADAWVFDVLPYSEEDDAEITADATITITPADTWTLPIPKVELRLCTAFDLGFTAAWKALDWALLKAGLKADLVQLNGYYQYSPDIRCELTLARPPRSRKKAEFWAILQRVVCGDGVGETLDYEAIGAAWAIQPSAVMAACVRLRKMGYEVRNRHTNSEIPPDHVLVPYAFPTLRPESVQRRKTLAPRKIQR